MKKHVFCLVIVSILIAVLFTTAVFGQEADISVIDKELFNDEILAEDSDAVFTEDAPPVDTEVPELYEEAGLPSDKSSIELVEDEETEAPETDIPVLEAEGADISEELVAAPGGSCGTSAEWIIEDGTLTISGTGALNNYHSNSSNRPPWYSYASTIKRIFVKEGITQIGAYAFWCLSNVNSVSLPSTCEKLGNASFSFCHGLHVIEFPSGIKTLDSYVFYQCENLSRVSFLGKAPTFSNYVFSGVTADVYYPTGNQSWAASSVRQNYGGTLTWKAVTYYNVWLSGIRINSGNKGDIFGDGGNASYDPSTRELSLSLSEYTSYAPKGAYLWNDSYRTYSARLYTPGTLTVGGTFVLVDEDSDYDIYAEERLNIVDSDTLLKKVYAGYEFSCSGTRIHIDDIYSSVIDFKGSEVYGTHMLAPAGNINFTSCFALLSSDSADSAPIECQGCTITDCYMKVSNTKGAAIGAYGVFRIRDTELKVEGKTDGIYSCGFDIQKGNKITADGSEGAMYGYYEPGGNGASKEFQIVPGYVFIEPADATIGDYAILSKGKHAARVVMRPLEASDKAALYYNNAAAKEVTIPTKSTAQLRLKTKDGYPVTAKWTSGNPEIASVDQNGLVTAHKYGKTKISCNTGSKTLTCNIKTLFYDVTDPNQPGYHQIYWGVDQGIIGGFGGGVYFGPEQSCTRLQFAIMIWRMKGKPAVSGSLSFSDTKSLSTTSDSYKAVLWAVKNGVIKGYSDNTFRPNNNITREQIVIILWRLAGQPKATKPLTFKDTTNLSKSSTSYKAIAWASEAGIVNGFSDNTFRKDENSKRNQIIIMIYRFVNKGYSG